MFHSFQTCTSVSVLSETEDEEKIDPTTVGYYINRKSTYAGLQTYCNYDPPPLDPSLDQKIGRKNGGVKGKVDFRHNKIVPMK